MRELGEIRKKSVDLRARGKKEGKGRLEVLSKPTTNLSLSLPTSREDDNC